MVKKIAFITIFVLFAGVLIYGAIYRTTEKTENASRIDAQNQGNNERRANGDELSSLGWQESGGQQYGQGSRGQGNQGQGNLGQGNQGQGNLGQGQGGQGQGNQNAGSSQLGAAGSGRNGQGQGRNQQRNAAEKLVQTTINGVVLQAPAEGIDMILETAQGKVLIGTGPGYLAEQGFVVLLGDSISVSGFWENEQFKAVQITNLADDSIVVLRDEWGRPMWSGAGRNAKNRQTNQDSG